MTEGSGRRPGARGKAVLSPKQRETVGRRLMILADQRPSIQAALKSAGFAAFEPRQAYDRDYAATFLHSQEERQIQERYETEILKGKLSLGTHKSPFVEELHLERIRMNGCSDRELSLRYPKQLWRRFADPLRRNFYKELHNIRDKPFGKVLEANRAAMLEEEAEAFRKEVPQHASELAKRRTYTSDTSNQSYFYVQEQTGEVVGATRDKNQVPARAALHVDAMEEYAGASGFAYDEKLTTKDYAIFSKQMAERVLLTFAIEEVRPFLLGAGDIRFLLQIRSPRHKGELSEERRRQCPEVPYTFLVPGVITAYWKFENLEELETITKAHMALYSLIAPTLEPAIKAALGPEGEEAA